MFTTYYDNKAPSGFGLGTPTTPAIDDLDNAPIASGWYQTYADTANCPPEQHSNYANVIIAGRGRNPAQILIGGTNTANTYITFRRKLNDTKWSEWQRLATTTPLGWYDLQKPDGWTGTLNYTKNQSGTVFVFLSCQTTTSPGVVDFAIGTLPAGYRPAFNITNVGIDVATGTIMTIVVAQSGRLVLRPYAGTNMDSWRGTRGCVVFPAS